jgi:hypothetical protein
MEEDQIVDLRLGFYQETSVSSSYHFFTPQTHQERTDIAREFIQRIFHIRFDRQHLQIAEEEEIISDADSLFSLPDTQVISVSETEQSLFSDPLDQVPVQGEGVNQVWFYNNHLNIYTLAQYTQIESFSEYINAIFGHFGPFPSCKPQVPVQSPTLLFSGELNCFYFEGQLTGGEILTAKYNKRTYETLFLRPINRAPHQRLSAVW